MSTGLVVHEKLLDLDMCTCLSFNSSLAHHHIHSRHSRGSVLVVVGSDLIVVVLDSDVL